MVQLWRTWSMYPYFLELNEQAVADDERLTQNDRVIKILRSERVAYYGLRLDRSGVLSAHQHRDDRLLYLIDYLDWLGTDVISTATVTADIGVTGSIVTQESDLLQILVSGVRGGALEITVNTQSGKQFVVCLRFYAITFE